MTRKWKDCDRCRYTAHEGKCSHCNGKGSIPLRPPIGEPVVYRNPLDGYVKEQVEKGEMKAADAVPMMRALIVTHADRVSQGGAPVDVRVSGWLLARSQRLCKPTPSQVKNQARYVDGIGWVISDSNTRPPMIYVEDIPGPSSEPGHWNWREDPS